MNLATTQRRHAWRRKSPSCVLCLLVTANPDKLGSAKCQQDRYDGWQCVERSFPVFGYVEGPLEFEMSNIVVINELGDSFIMTASEHPRRSFFWGELLLVQWLIGGVGWIAANHLLVLSDTDALALQSLNVFQTRQYSMLDHK